MPIPNYQHEVEKAIQKYPDAFAHAHVAGDPRRWEFIKLLVRDIRSGGITDEDRLQRQKVALNGKRGNPNDLSMDALNILCESAETDGRTPDQKPCVVVDVIASAGAKPPYSASNPPPRAAWSVYKTRVEGSGAHVVPDAVEAPDPPPPPPPPAVERLGRDEYMEACQKLHAFYMAPEGLQRPKGLWRDDTTPPGPDFEGIAAWVLDVYTVARFTGKSKDAAWQEVVANIRSSDEWKNKHPGEQP